MSHLVALLMNVVMRCDQYTRPGFGALHVHSWRFGRVRHFLFVTPQGGMHRFQGLATAEAVMAASTWVEAVGLIREAVGR